jgi:hypothetical protein
MIGGALGAALETEDAVREAAYIQRSDAQTERENAMIPPRSILNDRSTQNADPAT